MTNDIYVTMAECGCKISMIVTGKLYPDKLVKNIIIESPCNIHNSTDEDFVELKNTKYDSECDGVCEQCQVPGRKESCEVWN